MRFADWGHIRVNYLIFSKWECLSISFQEQEMKQRDHTESPHGDARLGKTLGGFTFCTLRLQPFEFRDPCIDFFRPPCTHPLLTQLHVGVRSPIENVQVEARRFYYACQWSRQ